MSFEMDTQTIQDLGIFDENLTRETVFSYFNKTRTFGAAMISQSGNSALVSARVTENSIPRTPDNGKTRCSPILFL